jgi:hypothetical protein
MHSLTAIILTPAQHPPLRQSSHQPRQHLDVQPRSRERRFIRARPRGDHRPLLLIYTQLFIANARPKAIPLVSPLRRRKRHIDISAIVPSTPEVSHVWAFPSVSAPTRLEPYVLRQPHRSLWQFATSPVVESVPTHVFVRIGACGGASSQRLCNTG